jgi:hypothetical protein
MNHLIDNSVTEYTMSATQSAQNRWELLPKSRQIPKEDRKISPFWENDRPQSPQPAAPYRKIT